MIMRELIKMNLRTILFKILHLICLLVGQLINFSSCLTQINIGLFN